VDELDPETLQDLRQRAKVAIRRRMGSLRSALPPAAVAKRSQAVVERLLRLPCYHSAHGVALFWPMEARREVDLRPVDAHAREHGKRVYYPFMEPAGDVIRTGFRRVDDASALVDGARGFRQPRVTDPVAERGDIDVVVVPALAVAESGHRIGYGAGFYDATLPDVRPPALAVVVVFDFQLLGELPVEAGDVAGDVVVTDARVLDATGEP
jgi:5-formyltetrahydrofolate cyclo-ligase